MLNAVHGISNTNFLDEFQSNKTENFPAIVHFSIKVIVLYSFVLTSLI